jgi:hypothetical protein
MNLLTRSYHTRPARHVPLWHAIAGAVLGLLALAAWGYMFALAYLTGLT